MSEEGYGDRIVVASFRLQGNRERMNLMGGRIKCDVAAASH
jgi:hypothetical protein